jgi:hypothetical protein
MSNDLSIEMLSVDRVVELWPVIEPFFEAACASHVIAKDEMQASDYYILATLEQLAILVCFDGDTPALALAIQFSMVNSHKCAEIMGLGGRKLFKFKTAYWQLVLDWLRANDVEFLDAFASDRMAKIYRNKFGFEKSCQYVRMTL